MPSPPFHAWLICMSSVDMHCNWYDYRVHNRVLLHEQVRNLRPATKVALDFVAPESAGVAQRLREVAVSCHSFCLLLQRKLNRIIIC